MNACSINREAEEGNAESETNRCREANEGRRRKVGMVHESERGLFKCKE